MKLLITLFFFTILARSIGMKSKNPCHPDRKTSKLGVLCEHIQMPPKLCSSCKIASYDEKGNFNDCQAIYDINEPECSSALKEYVDLNPCDNIRADQLADLSDTYNQRAIDYFVYSVCEQCCDCIPYGAEVEEYAERKASKKLISLVRGNCPAHARFDVCKIWPEIRHLTKPGRKVNARRFPKACPLLEEWFQSSDSANWKENNNVVISSQVKRFLKNFTRFAKCRDRKTWEACIGLESAQERI